MKWFYATGGNGSYIECEDGRNADTVEDSDSTNFDILIDESEADIDARWVTSPMLSQFSDEEMVEYVGE